MMEETKVQHLPPEGAYICDRCKEEVLFRVVRTSAFRGDVRKCYAYLQCPKCGARATQIRWARRKISVK